MAWRYWLGSSGLPGSGQGSIGWEGLSLLTLITLTTAPRTSGPFPALTSSVSNAFPSSHSGLRRVVLLSLNYLPSSSYDIVLNSSFLLIPKDNCDEVPKAGHCLSPEIVTILILQDPKWIPLFINKGLIRREEWKILKDTGYSFNNYLSAFSLVNFEFPKLSVIPSRCSVP